jgi:hypothetical protein
MTFIWCQNGATSWDWQIGRVWVSVTKPKYWGHKFPPHLGFIKWCGEEYDA